MRSKHCIATAWNNVRSRMRTAAALGLPDSDAAEAPGAPYRKRLGVAETLRLEEAPAQHLLHVFLPDRLHPLFALPAEDVEQAFASRSKGKTSGAWTTMSISVHPRHAKRIAIGMKTMPLTARSGPVCRKPIRS